jgi:hypothetical protein
MSTNPPGSPNSPADSNSSLPLDTNLVPPTIEGLSDSANLAAYGSLNSLEANNNQSPRSNAPSHSVQTTIPSSSNPQDTPPVQQPACAHPLGSLDSLASFLSSNLQYSSVPPATQSPPDAANLATSAAFPSPALLSYLYFEPSITSPPPNPPPPSRRNDHIGDFLRAFHHLIRRYLLTARWDDFRNNQTCNLARPPCIKGYRRFCHEIGGEFLELMQQREFRRQGTRARCECENRTRIRESSPLFYHA